MREEGDRQPTLFVLCPYQLIGSFNLLRMTTSRKLAPVPFDPVRCRGRPLFSGMFEHGPQWLT
jgi:hypothetical protein